MKTFSMNECTRVLRLEPCRNDRKEQQRTEASLRMQTDVVAFVGMQMSPARCCGKVMLTANHPRLCQRPLYCIEP